MVQTKKRVFRPCFECKKVDVDVTDIMCCEESDPRITMCGCGGKPIHEWFCSEYCEVKHYTGYPTADDLGVD